MKLLLYQDSQVGSVTVNPYSYEYTGEIPEVEEYLSFEPIPSRVDIHSDWEYDVDESPPEVEVDTTGEERLDRIAIAVEKRGIWATEIVE